MPYDPWPDQGCSLAETRGRLSGTRTSISCAATALFVDLFKIQALVSYGRAGSTTASVTLIAPPVWGSVTSLDWKSSSLRFIDNAYYDVRVFPVLLAPCRVDLLADRPLVEVFRKYILEDPEVKRLGERAIAHDEAFRRVFAHGCCYAQSTNEWPTDYEHRGLTGANGLAESPVRYLADPDPPVVLKAAAALISRYGALMSLLRQGELEAQGLADDGTFARIPPSIWMHPKFWFDAKTGDVSEVNQQAKDLPWDRLIKRWSAAMLSRPRIAHSPFHVEPSEHDTVRSSTTVGRRSAAPRRLPKTEAVLKAMQHSGIDIATTPLSPKEIAAKIAHLVQHEYSAGRFNALVKLVSRLRINRRSLDN